MVKLIAAGAGAAGLAIGGLYYAALWPESRLFGNSILAGNDPTQIALTYDDGPNDRWTEPLLDLLARRNIRATFFLIGRYARQYPAIVRQVHAAGHLVGSHTLTHRKLMYAGQREMRAEIAHGVAAIEDALGHSVRYFRPPFGSRRPVLFQILRDLGQLPVMWNVSSHDWDAPSPESILTRIRTGLARNRQRGRGSNILLHDGGHRAMGADRSRTISATSSLLAESRDLRFVTVDAWAGNRVPTSARL
jgi:peptidoglycan/xylan/chitin deacetylase (PgdA/CDA1 family)